jgi:hypothetical protein
MKILYEPTVCGGWDPIFVFRFLIVDSGFCGIFDFRMELACFQKLDFTLTRIGYYISRRRYHISSFAEG